MDRAVILAVDDDPLVLEAVKAVLGSDYQVSTALSAEEGMKLLEDRQVNTIISDYKMPGKDGLTFLAEARKRFPGTTMILMTAFADMNLVIRALNEGDIHRFLAKPYQPAELRRIVDECVELSSISEEKSPASKAMKTLILAHDSYNLLERFRIAFRFSFKVHTTSSGLEVLDLVASKPPSALVIGIRLGFMDGPTIAAYLKQEKQVPFPVVILSSDDCCPEGYLKQIGADYWIDADNPAIDKELKSYLEAHAL